MASHRASHPPRLTVGQRAMVGNRTDRKGDDDALLVETAVQALHELVLIKYWSTNSLARRITVKSTLDSPKV